MRILYFVSSAEIRRVSHSFYGHVVRCNGLERNSVRARAHSRANTKSERQRQTEKKQESADVITHGRV